jgi:hypothetical protein
MYNKTKGVMHITETLVYKYKASGFSMEWAFTVIATQYLFVLSADQERKNEASNFRYETGFFIRGLPALPLHRINSDSAGNY